MNLSKKRMVLLIYTITNLLLILGILSNPVFPLDYPTKPITLMVGFPAGGGGDLAARTIAGYFSKKWGQQIIVVNKPGGNLVPVNLELYTSKPDGYTLLSDTNGASSIQAAIIKNLPYKVEDRTFLVNGFLSPTVFLCSATKPWKTIKDVMDYAKREPNNFKWGALGVSSTTTFAGIQFLDVIGVDILKTKKMDCKGGPELLVSIANGEIDLANYGIGPSLPLIDAGKLRPLALISPQRIKRMPAIPIVKEEGFPGLTIVLFFGISGPPGLPKEIVEKWNQGMKEASTDPEFISIVEKIGNIMYYLPPDAYKKMVLEEIKNYTELAQKMGIR